MEMWLLLTSCFTNSCSRFSLGQLFAGNSQVKSLLVIVGLMVKVRHGMVMVRAQERLIMTENQSKSLSGPHCI